MTDLDSGLLRGLYQHRLSLNEGDTLAKETPEYWNDRARKFAVDAHSAETREKTKEFLSLFNWSSDESVLDVAAGPGTYSLPLARIVREVVATDFSEAMLHELNLKAAEESLTNIKTMHGRWLSMKITEKFDTVLCLNSLGVIASDSGHEPHLDQALQRLRDCCNKRLIILVPHADSPLPEDLRLVLGLSDIPIERRRIAAIFMAMVENGMMPEFTIIYRDFYWQFADVNEARHALMKKAGLQLPEKQGAFEDFLQKRLEKITDNTLRLTGKVAQGLFIWQRP